MRKFKTKFFTLIVILFNISAYSMEYVEICKSKNDCKKFSRLVMGTDHLIQKDWVYPGWPEYPDATAFEIIDHAADLGINFFDTSPIYVGGVEYRLGKWRASRKLKRPNNEIHILSKGGFPFDLFWFQNIPEGDISEELNSELLKYFIQYPPGTYASRLYGTKGLMTKRVREELGHTLNNLNGDVTIYLMHRDDGDAINFQPVVRAKTPVKTILEALSEPEIKNNVWMMGVSNWEEDRVNDAIAISANNYSLSRPVINSPYFSLFEMSKRTIHALGTQVTHKEMMDKNFLRGIKIMPYSPLGGFSILDKPEPRWENAKKDAKEKFESGDPYWRNVYNSIFTPENEQRWYRVLEFTENFNKKNNTQYTVDQMMNAYVLAHPRTDLLAVGPITKAQLDRTVKALKLSKKLTAMDLDYLYSGNNH